MAGVLSATDRSIVTAKRVPQRVTFEIYPRPSLRDAAVSHGKKATIKSGEPAMKPSEALTAHRDELRQLVSRYGLSRPRVFGSVLSGGDTEESDLDLLVDPGRSTSLLTIAGLKIDAEKLLGVPVSILTPNGLPPKFRNEVLQQAQPL
ncbi:MAG: nucleotidyltransferase family protein [Bryobacteraceae bacterium]|jgi:predicted nucleotidyltransferase